MGKRERRKVGQRRVSLKEARNSGGAAVLDEHSIERKGPAAQYCAAGLRTKFKRGFRNIWGKTWLGDAGVKVPSNTRVQSNIEAIVRGAQKDR